MPRICLVTHFFPPHMGGIEKVSYEQSKRLTEAGYIFDVLTSKVEGQSLNPTTGIRVYPYPSLKFAERFGVPYPISPDYDTDAQSVADSRNVICSTIRIIRAAEKNLPGTKSPTIVSHSK